jgi:hypothetical protein
MRKTLSKGAARPVAARAKPTDVIRLTRRGRELLDEHDGRLGAGIALAAIAFGAVLRNALERRTP